MSNRWVALLLIPDSVLKVGVRESPRNGNLNQSAPLLQRSFRSCRELRLNLRPSTRCVQLAKSLVWLFVTRVEPLVDRERPGTDGILLAY